MGSGRRRNAGSLCIGIDFDNTLVCYDQLFYDLAQKLELVDSEIPPLKNAVRSFVRDLPDGEARWQQLQRLAYGEGIERAILFPGVHDFLSECRLRSAQVYVVSHKTESVVVGENRVPLREAAWRWIYSHGLLDSGRTGLCRRAVFFEETREEKLRRIRQLDCTHFIDDLEEVFQAPGFPPDTQPLLFSPHSVASHSSKISTFSSWREIAAYLFGGTDHAN